MTKETESLESQIRDLKENHLAHIYSDLTEVKTNVSWLMKFFWIVASAAIGSLITGLITLLR